MTTENPVILFDGVCNFCNAGINFIIRQDKKSVFRFAPLQSAAGQSLAEQFNLPSENFDSFVLVDNGKIYTHSTGGIKVFNKLGWYWKWTYLLWIFPKFLRDGVYKFIAANRYKWFGKKDQCMMPTPAVREVFLK